MRQWSVFAMALASVACTSSSHSPSTHLPIDSPAEAGCTGSERARFDVLSSLDWQPTLVMQPDEDWSRQWFLDGEYATVNHRGGVLDFAAGPIAGDDAHHAVLWTRQSFSGDVKIEYDWTKLDRARSYVNILYVQASGEPAAGFAEDIAQWADERRIPKMSAYFGSMNTLHISYSATALQGAQEYVRARRYEPAKGVTLERTDLAPDYFSPGLFQRMGEVHHITVIKHGDDLFLDARTQERACLFHWRLDQARPVKHGRIGLRHMYTRHSSYRGFRVSTLP